MLLRRLCRLAALPPRRSTNPVACPTLCCLQEASGTTLAFTGILGLAAVLYTLYQLRSSQGERIRLPLLRPLPKHAPSASALGATASKGVLARPPGCQCTQAGSATTPAPRSGGRSWTPRSPPPRQQEQLQQRRQHQSRRGRQQAPHQPRRWLGGWRACAASPSRCLGFCWKRAPLLSWRRAPACAPAPQASAPRPPRPPPRVLPRLHSGPAVWSRPQQASPAPARLAPCPLVWQRTACAPGQPGRCSGRCAG